MVVPDLVHTNLESEGEERSWSGDRMKETFGEEPEWRLTKLPDEKEGLKGKTIGEEGSEER